MEIDIFSKMDELALFRYEKKLSYWKEQEEKAKCPIDWSKINWARNQIRIIEKQIEDCKQYVNLTHYSITKKRLLRDEKRRTT